jgi:hypothetical protein
MFMPPSPPPTPELIRILGRALIDEQFREDFISDPNAATQDYPLTAEERQRLDNTPADELRSFARVYHRKLSLHFI